MRQVSGNQLLERKYGLSPRVASERTLARAEAKRRTATQELVAPRRGKAYRLSDCRWVADTPPESLLHFGSIQEAEAEGLRPRRTCWPRLKH